MKTKKYFFSEIIEDDNTDIGKRNKMRLNKLLHYSLIIGFGKIHENYIITNIKKKKI